MAIERLLVHYGFEAETTGVHLARAALDSGFGYPRPCLRGNHLPVNLITECDGYLWVESGASSYPIRLDRSLVPTAGYLIDVHLHLQLSLLQSALFDVVFVAQRDYVDAVRAVNPNTHWLPLAAPAWFLDLPRHPKYDVGFVGSLAQSERRRLIIQAIGARFSTNVLSRHYSVADMADVYASSRVVVNPPVHGDVNMRFFEAMACGAALLSPPLSNGLDDLATPGKQFEIASFASVEGVVTAVEELLASGRAGEMGARARELVRARHTYMHRLAEVLEHLGDAKPSAPVRAMSPQDRSRHQLALAAALRDQRLLTQSAGGLRWTPSTTLSAAQVVASASRRILRDHRRRK